GLVYKLVFGGAVAFVVLAVLSGLLLRHHIGESSRVLGRLLPAIYNGRLLKFLRRRFPTYDHFEQYMIGKVDNLLSPLSRAAASPKALTKMVSISAVSWLAVCLAHKLLFAGLGVEIAFSKVLVIVTISTFLGDISMAPGGAGFLEAAMIALCAAFGIEQQAAAAVTLMGRGIFYFFGLGLGGISLAVLSAIYGRTQREDAEPEAPDALPEGPLEKG
ncbi:MAG: flippase-like domain-containing protein, partial [Candidatus Brocadiia bacterium]